MIRLLHFIRDLLIIRRVEFRIAEIPIIAMAALLINTRIAPLKTQTFWEGVLIFFFLFAFALGENVRSDCRCGKDQKSNEEEDNQQCVTMLAARPCRSIAPCAHCVGCPPP